MVFEFKDPSTKTLDSRNHILLWNYSKLPELLSMEELLHHLGPRKPCKYWDKLLIKWCRISSINSTCMIDLSSFYYFFFQFVVFCRFCHGFFNQKGRTRRRASSAWLASQMIASQMTRQCRAHDPG